MLKQKAWLAQLLGLFMLALVTFPLTVHAQTPDAATPNHVYLPMISSAAEGEQNGERLVGNTGDPNYVFTPEELQSLAVKEDAAEQHLKENFTKPENGEVNAAYLKGSKELSIGTWREPYGDAYKNYCGPGATQVALDARLPASEVPAISKLAEEEGTVASWGTDIRNICRVLNTRLNTNWYEYGSASSQTQMTTWLLQNVDQGYAFVTGLVTYRSGAYLNGWRHAANHIVAVYGYANVYVESTSTYGTVKYAETASTSAGYSGPYLQSTSFDNFWSYVKLNSYQCW